MPEFSTCTFGIDIGGEFWPWPDWDCHRGDGVTIYQIGWLYFGLSWMVVEPVPEA